MKVFKLQAHEKPINSLKLNFDGDLMFSGSSDKQINLWNSYTGERLGSYTCKGANRSIDITNDSKYLFTGSLDGVLELFQVIGGEYCGFMRKMHKIKYMELSYGDSQLLVLYESFVGNINEVVIYDTQELIKFLQNGKDKEQQEKDCPAIRKVHPSQGFKISQCRWGYLNKYLLLSTLQGEMLRFDLDGNLQLQVKAHDFDIKTFSVSKDFSIILSCGQDGCKILDINTFECLKRFKQEVAMNIGAISPLYIDNEQPKYHCLMGGGVPAREAAQTKEGGFEIHLCNIMYEKEIGTIPGHFGPVNCLIFHQDGRGFVSGGEEGNLRLHRFDKSYFENDTFE